MQVIEWQTKQTDDWPKTNWPSGHTHTNSLIRNQDANFPVPRLMDCVVGSGTSGKKGADSRQKQGQNLHTHRSWKEWTETGHMKSQMVTIVTWRRKWRGGWPQNDRPNIWTPSWQRSVTHFECVLWATSTTHTWKTDICMRWPFRLWLGRSRSERTRDGRKTRHLNKVYGKKWQIAVKGKKDDNLKASEKSSPKRSRKNWGSEVRAKKWVNELNKWTNNIDPKQNNEKTNQLQKMWGTYR